MDLAASAAERYGVPVALVYAVVEQESNWKPRAYNPEGSGTNPSLGLMQIRVSTARGLGFVGEPEGLYNPYINLDLGCKFLGDLISNARKNGFGTDSAISSYNGGPSTDRPGDGKRGVKSKGKCTGGLRDPFCNQSYVDSVVDRWARYAAEIPKTPTATNEQGLLLLAALGGYLLYRLI